MMREDLTAIQFGDYLIKVSKSQSDILQKISLNHTYTLRDCNFLFEFDLSFRDYFLQKIQGTYTLDQLYFIRDQKIRFLNCKFKNLTLFKKSEQNFEFDEKCEFEELSFNDSTFEGKLKFWNCTFNKTNFNNTTFSDLVDFYNCTFKQKVFFFKTDFKGTTVFSASTFEQNVLFTYALIEKLIIFRGTKFEKGLDLSLAIIKGEINPFDIQISDSKFKAKSISKKHFNELSDEFKDKSFNEKFEKVYDSWITTEGIIAYKNKQETYRILKEAFISREDISSSVEYKVNEKETLKRRLESEKYYNNKKVKFLFNKIPFHKKLTFEWVNLWLNKWSNYYGDSYLTSLGFISVIGFFFFYLSAINSSSYFLSCSIDCDTISQGFGHFMQFLLPTHDIEYLGDIEDQSNSFFLFDFLGRVFVGYGIYQFIQAFRKYR